MGAKVIYHSKFAFTKVQIQKQPFSSLKYNRTLNRGPMVKVKWFKW